MKMKLGEGNHLQSYDENTGQYNDEIKPKMSDKDMENLVMVYLYGFDNEERKFHFPRKSIHNDEYCDLLVRYLRDNNLYGQSYIEDQKLEKHLFKHKDKDDKSKYMVEVLGFENNSKGWRLAKAEILKGVNLKTMKFGGPFNGFLKVSMRQKIKDVYGRYHDIITIWEVQENLDLRFITLIPGGRE